MSVTLEYFGCADIMPPLFIGCAPAYFLRRFLVRQFPATALCLTAAVFGFIAFLLAQAYAPKIATKKGLTIGLMVVQIVLAIIGIIVLVMMFSALSH